MRAASMPSVSTTSTSTSCRRAATSAAAVPTGCAAMMNMASEPQLALGMWIAMMAAMMLPGAVPAMARTPRKLLFALAYLSLWIAAEKAFRWGGGLAAVAGVALIGWGSVGLFL